MTNPDRPLPTTTSQLVSRSWSSALHQVDRLAGWLTTKARGEKIILLLLTIGLPLLVFYNLELNPRPWHDEGASLILARTLAEDGVYAMRSSDGYQTYGPVQSVGPTVIVPVALVYRWFGVGLLQGRLVVALYTLAALLLFYLVGRKLFDGWTAILGLLFLLAAPAVRIFIYGREVLGEVPGLAFFLAGWLALARSLESRHLGWAALAGLLFGTTIITKSQYLVMIPATLVLLAALDLLYYRQGAWKSLALVTVLALACSFAWQAWQIVYYGMQSYQADLAKLGQLAAVTTGLHLQTIAGGIRSILGSDSGHFYLFWGFPALGYAAVRAFQRSPRGLLLASVVIFTTLWLLYFTFWTVSWHRYALPAMALLALLIASLYLDLGRLALPPLRDYFRDRPAGAAPPAQAVLAFGTLIGLFSLGLWAGYNLQQYLRSDVLDRYGEAEAELFTPPQLQAPGAVAAYLAQNIPPGSLIETWERELGILTDYEFHYPDQSMLAAAHKDEYLGEQSNYQLGEDYFQQVQPDYVIVGFYSRLGPIYNMDYLTQHSQKIWSAGSGGFQYDIYQMNR